VRTSKDQGVGRGLAIVEAFDAPVVVSRHLLNGVEYGSFQQQLSVRHTHRTDNAPSSAIALHGTLAPSIGGMQECKDPVKLLKRHPRDLDRGTVEGHGDLPRSFAYLSRAKMNEGPLGRVRM